MRRLNQALCEWMEGPELFVTAFYGVLDPEAGQICYASAGHWPALLAGAQRTEVVGGHGLVLGGSREALYGEGQLGFEAGDTLLLFTDGLVEVGDEDPMEQMETVLEWLGRERHQPPDRLLEGLFQDAMQRGRGPLRDDLALLLVRRAAQPQRASGAVSPALAHPRDAGAVRRQTLV